MKKIFSIAAALMAAAMTLTGCTLPGQNKGRVNNHIDMVDSYSYTPPEDDQETEVEAYKWLLQPSIKADNIIVFDGSSIDPNEELSRMYVKYAVIREDGKYGLIDYSANLVIKPEYDDYYLCWCGEIVLVKIIDDRKGEYEYCTIDPKTRNITETPAHTENKKAEKYYWDEGSNKIFVMKNGDKAPSEYTGKKAVPVTQAKISLDDFGAYVLEVPEGAKCGLAKQGQLLTDLVYTDFYAAQFRSAGEVYVALKNEEGKWGYFDAEGNERLECQFDGDSSAYNGKLCDDESKTHPYLFNGEYIPVLKDGYYGYYDYEGNCVVKFGELEQVRPVNNGRAWVRKDDSWGIIQLGELIDEPEPKDESSQVTTTTVYWTDTTTAANTIIIGYDELGQPIYSWVDPNAYTEPEWTEETEPVTYDPTLDPGYVDPGADPAYSDVPLYVEPEPQVTEPAAPPDTTVLGDEPIF